MFCSLSGLAFFHRALTRTTRSSTAAIKREQDAFSEETALAEARAAEERRQAEEARLAQEAEARKQAIQDEINAALTEEIPFIKVR